MGLNRIKELKNIRADVKEAQRRVKAVNDCPTCLEHLNAIKEHTSKGHKD